MSVIINDFEVVAEAPQAEPAEEETAVRPLPRLTPGDVYRLLRRRQERLARVVAH